MTRNWMARTTQNSGRGNGNVRWSGGTSSKIEGSKNGTVTAPSSPADPASTAAVFRSLTMLTSCGMCGCGSFQVVDDPSGSPICRGGDRKERAHGRLLPLDAHEFHLAGAADRREPADVAVGKQGQVVAASDRLLDER